MTNDLVEVPFEGTEAGTEILRLIEKADCSAKDREEELRRVASAKRTADGYKVYAMMSDMGAPGEDNEQSN